MANLTIIILTKNEEQNLEKCMLSTKKGKKQLWNDVKFIKDFDAAIIYNNSLKYA